MISHIFVALSEKLNFNILGRKTVTDFIEKTNISSHMFSFSKVSTTSTYSKDTKDLNLFSPRTEDPQSHNVPEFMLLGQLVWVTEKHMYFICSAY